MGNNSCKNVCKGRRNFFEVDFEAIMSRLKDKNKIAKVILLQSNYRRYRTQKELQRLKSKTPKDVFSYIDLDFGYQFKESWNIYFKKHNKDYDFSITGLSMLKSTIFDFYYKFFSTDKSPAGKKEIVLKENHFTTVTDKNSFEENFKNVILKNLVRDFKIGDYNKNLCDLRVEIEKLHCPFDEESVQINVGKLENSNQPKENSSPEIWFKQTTGKSEKSHNSSNNKSHTTADNPNLKLTRKFYPQRTKFVLEVPEKKVTLLLNSQGDLYLSEALLDMEKEGDKKVVQYFNKANSVFFQGDWDVVSRKKSGLGFEYMVNEKKSQRYKYIGYYKQNKFHGFGILIYESGLTYFGEFRNGEKTGYGIESRDEYTVSYRGFFLRGVHHGFGEQFSKSNYYVGEFRDGRKNGFGHLSLRDNNSTYTGQFEDNQMSGKGCYFYANGQVYFGDWRKDKMEGFGQCTWPKGDIYRGYYKNDQRHGLGEYFFKSKGVLRGTWYCGKKEGKFELKEEGEIHELIYKDGALVE